MSQTVKVMVRMRPMNALEKQKGSKAIVQIDENANQVILQKIGEDQNNLNNKVFAYDTVFGSNINQAAVYEATGFSLVEAVVQGYNATIFAYGQTGCGKTHTMMGCPDSEDLKGIIPRTFSHILNIVQSQEGKRKFLIRCSFIEIYNEQIHDLLGQDIKQKKQVKEDSKGVVYVKDLCKHVVKSINQMDNYMMTGFKNRATGQTLMNKDSSRSHSIFTLYIQSSYEDDKTGQKFTAGKLNLVDLAGSQRQSKTKAQGQRLKQATKINLSLSALGNVISALVDGKSSHIPYRDSKLTRLLQDSLGGNTKTLMIANISPADYNYDQTLSTLRYASRAKFIKNKPTVNEDPKDAMLRQYAQEIKKLKQMLNQHGHPQILLKNNISGGNFEINQPYKNQKISINQQLQEKQELYRRQKQQKNRIQQNLKQLEQQMLNMVPTTFSNNLNHNQNTKKYKQLKVKVKQQRLQHEKLLEDRAKHEQQICSLQNQYKSLQQETFQSKKVIAQLRKMYQLAKSQIQDLQKQNQFNKDQLLETIREQDKQIKFYAAAIKNLLRNQQLQIIRTAAIWNEDLKQYKIPVFNIKDKKIYFPKLKQHQAEDYIRHQLQKKQIKFQNSQQKNEQMNEKPRKLYKQKQQKERQKRRKQIMNNTSTTNYECSITSNIGSCDSSSLNYQGGKINDNYSGGSNSNKQILSFENMPPRPRLVPKNIQLSPLRHQVDYNKIGGGRRVLQKLQLVQKDRINDLI